MKLDQTRPANIDASDQWPRCCQLPLSASFTVGEALRSTLTRYPNMYVIGHIGKRKIQGSFQGEYLHIRPDGRAPTHPNALGIGGQQIDPRVSIGKMMITMFAATAEFERDLLLERQREGVAKAKVDGKYKGRKPTARAKAAEVLRLSNEGLQRTEIARRLDIGVASVYRILAEAKKRR